MAVNPKFGVHRTVTETQSMGRLLGAAGDLGLQIWTEPGGGDVEGFFKERTVQGVGLVKQGQRLQAACGQQAFQGNLGARDETLDEDAFVGLILPLTYFRPFQQDTQAPESANELGWGIGAHDAPAR